MTHLWNSQIFQWFHHKIDEIPWLWLSRIHSMIFTIFHDQWGTLYLSTALCCVPSLSERICDEVACQPLPLWCSQVVEKHMDSLHEARKVSGAVGVEGTGGAWTFCLPILSQSVWPRGLWHWGWCWSWGLGGGCLRCSRSCTLGSLTVVISISLVKAKTIFFYNTFIIIN